MTIASSTGGSSAWNAFGHIQHPLRAAPGRHLRRRIALAGEHVDAQRHAEVPAHLPRQQFRLVVPALTQALAVQRRRHEHERRLHGGGQCLGHRLRHARRDGAQPAVLQASNGIARRSRIGERDDEARQQRRRTQRQRRGGFGGRQALGTEIRPRRATADAPRRQQQIERRVEK